VRKPLWLDIVQLCEHIIGIYRKSGERGGGKWERGRRGNGGEKKGVGEKKCKEAKVR